jgi:MFS family permease
MLHTTSTPVPHPPFLSLIGTVYFQDTLNTTPFYTSMGYAFFISFVFLGQLASDYLVVEYGPRNMLTFSGLLACLGLCCVVLAPSLNFTLPMWPFGPFVTAVTGFAIAGAGMSSIGPILVSQTGKLNVPGMTSAGKIGALTACSYLGLLVGPPFFGGLSVLLQKLRWALFVDAILMLSITPLSGIIFSEAGYPRLMNVSYSSIFDSSSRPAAGGNKSALTGVVTAPDRRAFSVESDRLI